MTLDKGKLPQATNLQVLVADDTASNRSMLDVFLRKLGFTAIMAADGKEAVARFQSDRPDLVLMDVMMPVMDGFEATRSIRRLQEGNWVPVVMLSALADDSDIAAGLDAGADDYLVKPISFAVFAAKMRSVSRQLMMQRAVVESLEQIRAISDAVIDGLITINEHGIMHSCNRAACAQFGYGPAELIGKNVSMLMPEPHHSAHDGYIRRYLETGSGGGVGKIRQVTGRRKNGALFPLELGITDIDLPDRHLFVGVVRDVTERERQARERAETRARLERLYAEQEREQELARTIMERQIHGDWLKDPRVQYSVSATTRFSGDLIMLARSPGGRTFAMLADATGHGLAAAISVLPVLSLFYTEVAREVSLSYLVSAINAQLRGGLPVGRFVGAAIFCLSADAREVELWVGGVPEVLLLDRGGGIARRFASDHVPLGITDNDEDTGRTERFAVEPGQQILAYSDGLIEAHRSDGEEFGQECLEQTLAVSAPERRVEAVRQALETHLEGEAHHDDVSMLLLTCVPGSKASEPALEA
ncbi:MAG: SpoIIE family protein phosphatase [Rhodocyclaceae bacterium]|nr:SpoIIE family protein phosphatase [Rhodocyclaceae bacterium]